MSIQVRQSIASAGGRHPPPALGSRAAANDLLSIEATPQHAGPALKITLFSEADVIPLAENHERGASRLVRELLAAHSPCRREAVVRERLDDMGFEWLAYLTLARNGDEGARCACLTSYAHVDWMRHYLEERYYEVDPRYLNLRRSSLPVVWDIADVEERVAQMPPSPRARRFVRELADSGIGSGILQRVASPGSGHGDSAVVSLGSAESNRRWIEDRVLGDALALGLSLHDFLSQHTRLPSAACDEPSHDAPGGTGLSAMQHAVLSHVVHGLTDREIALKLTVSSHTVDYHLRQLRHRFAVRNRVQLVAAAARFVADR